MIRKAPQRDHALIAAIYARVSTVAQRDGISLDDQVAQMLRYASQNSIVVPTEYQFQESISGLTDERPEYDKIRALIRDRSVNCLIVTSSDRHQRDPGIGAAFRAELRRFGCALHYVTEGEVDIYTPEGEVINSVKDSFNRYWLIKILQTTQDKKHAYTMEGVPLQQGRPRYGYRRIGKKEAARLEIVEERAAVVLRIFQWVDARVPVDEVRHRLHGTPTPGDETNRKDRKRPMGVWSLSQIYDILRDPIYSGVYYAYRHTMVEDERGRKRNVRRPREEWVAIAVPPIVPRDLWERVQARLLAGRRKAFQPTGKHAFLLARRAHCGVCGYAMTNTPSLKGKRVYYYYICSSRRKETHGAPCAARVFNASAADEAVWQFLRAFCRDPRQIIARMQHAQAEQQAAEAERNAQVADLDASIAELSLELERLAVALVKHDESSPVYRAIDRQMREHGATIQALQGQRARLLARARARIISEDDIATVEARTAAIADDLDHATFAEQRAVVEALDLSFRLDDNGVRQKIYIQWLEWEFDVEVVPPRNLRK